MSEIQQLKAKDFKSDQEIRWCPGCGDYSIIAGVQAVLADIGVARENVVMVSGIGCSSRFPYYMETYGFHSIHGRANAIATGVKVANPDLQVWVITGDGDGLSIGGNHMIHSLRRNVDLKIILFNNEIYGLTKGQYSPTSPQGLKTKTSPFGSVDAPFNPLQLALGSGATFVARTLDTQPKHMKEVLAAAAAHKGAAFVEVWQNCVIFNDGAFKDWTDKTTRDEQTIMLQPNQPMVFGKDQDKGLKIDGFALKVVPAAEASVWDPTVDSAGPAFVMTQLDADPAMPRPFGVFRSVQRPTLDELVREQITTVTQKRGPGALKDLLYTSDCWTVG
ncbi:MAG: 2-oxoacid:ferredoxin oxidoreductase subunit beta [bacterium]|nr:2-oxoacid:ferredoxin oxidoreductase subunit beta [bacterium]MBK7187727.1 2-oxoacid:ferredoxin oxidoreductase subunit beta [bacterium]